MNNEQKNNIMDKIPETDFENETEKLAANEEDSTNTEAAKQAKDEGLKPQVG